MPKINIPTLIAEGASIKARVKADAARLKEIEAELIRQGAGKHEGDNGASCTVIIGAAAIKLPKDAVDKVRELLGEEHFKTLFDRTVGYAPVKGFRDVAAAVLTEAKARKIIALCETPASPYVKW